MLCPIPVKMVCEIGIRGKLAHAFSMDVANKSLGRLD
jgi:hypothetical protein